MNTRSVFFYAAVAFVLVFVGVLVGAGIGSYTGYTLATRDAQAVAAVVQPVANTGVTLPDGPAKSENGSAQRTPVTPQPQPTAVPAADTTLITSGEDSIVAAVTAVQPATVQVLSQIGSGSGVIISEDGYIVTNYHVIEGSRRFAVVLSRGEQIDAQLVGVAPDFDLALLKIDSAVPAVAKWGDSSAVPLGASVIAIGSPLGEYQNTVTTGILSGYNRTLDTLSGLLQTDAAINHGNSGGPVLNRNGDVIGINTLVVRGGGSQAEGLGFAIPSNTAQGIVRQMMETGSAYRPYMGVDAVLLNPQVAAELSVSVTEGAYVREAVPNAPAALAGIQAGDVVTAIGGRPLNDRDTLQMVILSHVPSDDVSVTVLRNGETLEIPVTLGAAQ